MEQIRLVSGSWMSRLHIVSSNDAQSGSLEPFEQPRARSQAQVFRQVGKDQPALAARLQMVRQRPQESAQHLAFVIVYSVFQRRARPRGNPWRITDDERRATVGKKVRLHDIDAVRKTELYNILTGTGQRAWIEIGGDNALNAAPCKYRGEHTGARADIESNTG